MALERTFVMLKPDCVERRLAGKVLARFEEKGLRLVAMKLIQMTQKQAAEQYREHEGKGFYAGLVKFMTSAPCFVMVLEGASAVSVVRKLVGATNGRNAEPGTIRGDFGLSAGLNLVHASDGVERAKVEAGIFFRPEELVTPQNAIGHWIENSEDAS
ncbi:MAG: nucleoside-diphosphate kinase [Planctomycetes bacterium]|nr:nucleoside-diphosphate kinase [Planctomycetota bacterium]